MIYFIVLVYSQEMGSSDLAEVSSEPETTLVIVSTAPSSDLVQSSGSVEDTQLGGGVFTLTGRPLTCETYLVQSNMHHSIMYMYGAAFFCSPDELVWPKYTFSPFSFHSKMFKPRKFKGGNLLWRSSCHYVWRWVIVPPDFFIAKPTKQFR